MKAMCEKENSLKHQTSPLGFRQIFFLMLQLNFQIWESPYMNPKNIR
jgi:hypothetical protein